MAWSPLTHEHNASMLVLGSWDQSLSFFNADGQTQQQVKYLEYYPLSICWLKSSNFFVVTGTNNQAQLLSR